MWAVALELKGKNRVGHSFMLVPQGFDIQVQTLHAFTTHQTFSKSTRWKQTRGKTASEGKQVCKKI